MNQLRDTIFTTKSPNPKSKLIKTTLFILKITTLLITSTTTISKPPPLPTPPIPTSPQLKWQLTDMAMFLHFGPNTFTDSEWGSGHIDPTVFNPTRLDASQWVKVASESGFSRVVITAKHHDGFCLWPSEYTEYSVKGALKWKGGKGDVLKELCEAALMEGVDVGVYLSPWDRHERCYGENLEYNEFYLGQMRELLTRYGEIKEVWLDGAKGEGEEDMDYYFDSWFSVIHQLQPGAVIFSDAGPDTRWIGDEAGIAKSTCWSTFNRSDAKIGDTDPEYSKRGDPFGVDWVPAECDVSIRPGWFWHASEAPKSARKLLDIYYKSVGRNCLLLLNVPPNSSGLISDEDIQVLKEFKELRSSIFSSNKAANATLIAGTTRGGIHDTQFSIYNVLEEGIFSYWAPEVNQSDWTIHIKLPDVISFNVLQVQEPIQLGQRIIEFHLEALDREGNWKKVASGTTVGYRRLLLFPTVVSQNLRFVIDKSRADPLISYLGIYKDPFSSMSYDSVMNRTMNFNGSRVIKQAVYNNSRTISQTVMVQ